MAGTAVGAGIGYYTRPKVPSLNDFPTINGGSEGGYVIPSFGS
jgi:hypothetical protein